MYVGQGNEADFLGFLHNWIFIDPLHYLSSPSDSGFEFESATPLLAESASRFSITNISANSKPKSERLEM
jgi:hypothetical protein